MTGGAPPGGCACGCCRGTTAATPRRVDQRAGLPAVGYRVGTHGDFLASLVAALSDADRPALARLRGRDPRDFTMALLDAVATLCDVLTFYTERLAQESYLRTAVDRASLRELGRLVAYRLRPGVAASTYLAFFIQPAPSAPAATGAPEEAFAAGAYLPDGVVLPAGLPVRSVPGPGEQPQTYETGTPILARPQWNALRPTATRPTVLAAGATTAYLAGTGHHLRTGDALLIAPPAGNDPPWTTVTVAAAETQPDRDRTRVVWSPALPDRALPSDPRVSALRQRLNVFGHNAPPWNLLHTGTGTGAGDWSWNLSGGDDHSVDLDGSHPDLLPGTRLVISAPGRSPLLATITGVTTMSRSDFGMSGPITRVAVDRALSPYADQTRQASVLAGAAELPLAAEPDPSGVDGSEIVVDAAVADLPAGRTVLVCGLDEDLRARSELAEVAAATGLGATTRLTLHARLTATYRRDTVLVYANVAEATHGETVHQVLGSGNGSAVHQRFDLRHEPLTYLSSDQPDGAASTLRVRVNDVTWSEVPTLYQAPPGQPAFATRVDEQGRVLVVFGDGVNGARLPTGQHNVRADYRRGVGTAGNVPAGAISQVMDPPLGLTKATNPVAADGGADPEPVDAARQAIPLRVRTLGRAVSLTDYADFARAFAGVAKADATVLDLAGRPTIVVSVAAAGGAVVPARTRARLGISLREYGDPTAAFLVLPHRVAAFRLALRFRRAPDHPAPGVAAAIRATLAGAFAVDAREFGQPVDRSQVLAAAHRAPGVVAVDLDRLYRTVPPVPPEPGWPPPAPDLLADRLLAARPRVAAGTALAAELLSIDPDPFDLLAELP